MNQIKPLDQVLSIGADAHCHITKVVNKFGSQNSILYELVEIPIDQTGYTVWLNGLYFTLVKADDLLHEPGPVQACHPGRLSPTDKKGRIHGRELAIETRTMIIEPG